MAVSPGINSAASVLEGALERITYANPETGYTIARIDVGRGPDLITAVGPLLGAQVGESLRMRGRWTSQDYRLRTRLAVEESKPARFPGVVSFN